MQRTIQRELGLAQLPEPPDVADALAAALCHYYRARRLPGAEGRAMITKITGLLNRVLDEEVRLQVGPLEYQVLVPEFVRRQVQSRIGQEVTLHTSEYLDGNPMQGRVVPRLIGFPSEAELEFFELFCTVDKVGTRKAIKALVRPIKEIADAIQRQDAKWLTTLPGVGAATAEQIIATLRRKVTKFALMPRAAPTATAETPAAGDGDRRQRDRGRLPGADERSATARSRPATGWTRCWPAARRSSRSKRC